MPQVPPLLNEQVILHVAVAEGKATESPGARLSDRPVPYSQEQNPLGGATSQASPLWERGVHLELPYAYGELGIARTYAAGLESD